MLRVDGGTQSWREPWKPVAAAITDPRGRAREHLARCDALRKKVNLPRGHRAEVDRTRLRQLHCALLNVGLGVVGNAALWLLFFWGSVGLVGEGTDQVLARSLPGSPGSANGRSACRWMSACAESTSAFPPALYYWASRAVCYWACRALPIVKAIAQQLGRCFNVSPEDMLPIKAAALSLLSPASAGH